MDFVKPILLELDNIKLLLSFIAVCLLLITATFIFLAMNIVSVMRENRRSNSNQLKEVELEDLLAFGQNKAAKFTAMEWVAEQPRRPEAHWALARAHYQLGELSEAKQVLNGLLKVAPEEHYRVDAWLGLLEDEFAQKRPKSVD